MTILNPNMQYGMVNLSQIDGFITPATWWAFAPFSMNISPAALAALLQPEYTANVEGA
jgi:hypothetical protein